MSAAPAGDDAQIDLWLAQTQPILGDADVAGHGQLVAAAQGEATIHGGDDRLLRVLDLEEKPLALSDESFGFLGLVLYAVDLVDVGPGDEELARPGDDDGLHLVVDRRLVKGSAKFLDHLLVESVGRRVVNGQSRYPILNRDFDVLVFCHFCDSFQMLKAECWKLAPGFQLLAFSF